MFGLGVPELLIILVIILVIFGAGKLPKIGEGLGKGISNFKKSIKENGDIEDDASQDEKTGSSSRHKK
ncbi:MAG: twin-arginine translocase TatA/TatE family subunit [Dissulfuribacterales bacterium]